MTGNPAPASFALGQAPAPGDRLPPLVRTPTRVTCFLFALAWWAPHRVHYDIELARQEGYSDVMVPGLLLSEYAVSALTGWTGDPSTLRRLTVRNTAPAVAGDTLTVQPVVAEVATEPGACTIKFTFEMARSDGTAVMNGEGWVRIPAPAPPAEAASIPPIE